MFEIFERKLSAYQALPTGWLRVYVNVVLPLLSAFFTWKFLSTHILSPSPGWVEYGFSLATCLLCWVCTVLMRYLDRTAFFLNLALMLVGLAWAFVKVFKTPEQPAMAGMAGGAVPLASFGISSQSISLLIAIVLTMVLYFQLLYFIRRWALFNMSDDVRPSGDWDDTVDDSGEEF